MVQLIQDIECSKCGAINQKEEKWEEGKIIWRCKSCNYSKVIGEYSTTSTLPEGEYMIIEGPPIPPSKLTF